MRAHTSGTARSRASSSAGAKGIAAPSHMSRPRRSSNEEWARLQRDGADVRVVISRFKGADVAIEDPTKAAVQAAERLVELETAAAPPTRPALRHKQGVVIIGGGPAGLAAALALSKRGWTDITIVERHQDIMYDDRDRAYVYRLDSRGEQLLSHINFPTEVVDRYAKPTRHLSMEAYQTDGSVTNRQLPMGGQPGRWLPRQALVRMLAEDGLRLGHPQGLGSKVQVLAGHALEGMERLPRADGGWEIKLTVRDVSTGATQELYPQLVVGSDGINSAVRSALVEWEQQDKQAADTAEALAGAGSSSSRFELSKMDSPSAGLKYKVLCLPPRPVLTKGSSQPLEPEKMAVVVGKDQTPTRRMRLGFLPVHDADAPRTCNIILTSDEHELLKLKDAESLYKFMEEQLPQVPVRELIPLQEAQRFVQARPGVFPTPQHVNGLQFSTHAPGADFQGYGVVLVGDARAAFPPDAGQGVNSALEDVVRLAQALDQAQDQVPAALQRYEEQRLPDIRSLTRLMTFAGPYQYKQNPKRFTLWGLDLMARKTLHRLAPWLFNTHVMSMMSDGSVSYSEALARHHATSQRLAAVAAAAGALLLTAVAKAFGLF